VETAEVNSKEYKTSWTAEIIRYAIHGVLHIIGYDDYSLEEREKMRKLEDKYITI
jgi:probable rRNA maturation factor